MLVKRLLSGALSVCLFCAALLALKENGVTSAERPNFAIMVAVDLSSTWLSKASRASNERVLEQVGKAVVSASRRESGATSIRYLKIGESSFFQEPLCEATLKQRLLTPRTVTGDGVFTHVGALEDYLIKDCKRFILSRPEENYTDIQGAVFTAQKLSEGIARKAIVLLSDMKEERKPGMSPPTLSLDGVNVIIIYRVLKEDRSDPAALDRRLASWKTLLGESGAQVLMMPDLGVKAERIEAELMR